MAFKLYRSGAGALWSNRMNIQRGRRRLRRGHRSGAPGRKIENGTNLLSRQVKPFRDFVDGGPGFKVLEHEGDRHPRVLENPSAADLTGNALHGGAL